MADLHVVGDGAGGKKATGTRTPPRPRRRIEYLPLDDVWEAARNPKGHDADGIRSSIGRWGYAEPVLLDERTQRLVAGHGRLAALRELRSKAGKTGRGKGGPPDGVTVREDGAWLLPVVRGWSSRNDAEAEAYLLASNRLTERGGWDDAGLAELIASIDQTDPALVAAAGFTEGDVDALLRRLEAAKGDPGPPATVGSVHDAPPVEEDPPLSRLGEVIDLGPHRLVVGSADEPATLTKVLGGERAACLWTDPPPYGVNPEGRTARRMKLLGDADAPGALVLFARVLEAIIDARALAPGAAYYVAHPQGPDGTGFLALLSQAPWVHKQSLVWVKDALVLGHSDYHYRHEPLAHGTVGDLPDDVVTPTPPYVPNHEPIAYGRTEGGGRRGRGAGGWRGGHAQTSVFEVARPKRSDLHPSMKPIDLVAGMLRNSVRPGQLVLDPFAGSGSTLLAAHAVGARARLVELDPRFADVICRRWQHVSGEPPLVDGVPRPYPPIES